MEQDTTRQKKSYKDITDEMFESICAELVNGKSLRQIGSEIGYAINMLLQAAHCTPERDAQYARARIEQANQYSDRIQAEIDNCDNRNYCAVKVKVDALKWLACKLHPKAYGDKLAHTDADGNTMKVIVENLTTVKKPNE